MAHFAKLDDNNIVTEVVVVNNNVLLDSSGVEQEGIGVEFLKNLYGSSTNWKQTSYSSSIRKNYAGIGFTYDSVRDAFIAPQPYESWLFDEEDCKWNPPTPYPNDGSFYTWDEPTVSWKPLLINKE